MPYQILFIDADHTLFDFDQSEEIAFKKLLKQIKQEEHFSTLFPIYVKQNRETWRDFEKGIITQDKLKTERFQRFIDTAKISGNASEFASIFTKHLADASILYEGAYDIIEKLSKKYRLVIVTNGLKDVQTKRIGQSTISPLIEALVISDEIGISKPNPKIIDHALDLINHSKRDDVVIIGDSLTSDIQCGFNAGIDTIWYNPKQLNNTLDREPTHTISDLKELLQIL